MTPVHSKPRAEPATRDLAVIPEGVTRISRVGVTPAPCLHHGL